MDGQPHFTESPLALGVKLKINGLGEGNLISRNLAGITKFKHIDPGAGADRSKKTGVRLRVAPLSSIFNSLVCHHLQTTFKGCSYFFTTFKGDS